MRVGDPRRCADSCNLCPTLGRPSKAPTHQKMILVSTLEWSRYQDGWLAQAKPGYLFILSRFDSDIGFNRWFVLYSTGPHFSIENSRLIGDRHGYMSLGEAKFEAEQNLKFQRISSRQESSVR